MLFKYLGFRGDVHGLKQLLISLLERPSKSKYIIPGIHCHIYSEEYIDTVAF